MKKTKTQTFRKYGFHHFQLFDLDQVSENIIFAI